MKKFYQKLMLNKDKLEKRLILKKICEIKWGMILELQNSLLRMPSIIIDEGDYD